MDWTIWAPVIAGVGGLLVGVTPSARRWLAARAKRIEADANAVKLGAEASGREATAKVKLVEAQAEATKAEAAVDAYMVKRVEDLETKVTACEAAHAACEAAQAAQGATIREMQGRIEVLFAKTGLTPKAMERP